MIERKELIAVGAAGIVVAIVVGILLAMFLIPG
jgi:hypothetical protein